MTTILLTRDHLYCDTMVSDETDVLGESHIKFYPLSDGNIGVGVGGCSVITALLADYEKLDNINFDEYIDLERGKLFILSPDGMFLRHYPKDIAADGEEVPKYLPWIGDDKFITYGTGGVHAKSYLKLREMDTHAAMMYAAKVDKSSSDKFFEIPRRWDATKGTITVKYHHTLTNTGHSVNPKRIDIKFPENNKWLMDALTGKGSLFCVDLGMLTYDDFAGDELNSTFVKEQIDHKSVDKQLSTDPKNNSNDAIKASLIAQVKKQKLIFVVSKEAGGAETIANMFVDWIGLDRVKGTHESIFRNVRRENKDTVLICNRVHYDANLVGSFNTFGVWGGVVVYDESFIGLPEFLDFYNVYQAGYTGGDLFISWNDDATEKTETLKIADISLEDVEENIVFDSESFALKEIDPFTNMVEQIKNRSEYTCNVVSSRIDLAYGLAQRIKKAIGGAGFDLVSYGEIGSSANGATEAVAHRVLENKKYDVIICTLNQIKTVPKIKEFLGNSKILIMISIYDVEPTYNQTDHYVIEADETNQGRRNITWLGVDGIDCTVKLNQSDLI